jgi:hypothetical protein
MARLRIEPALNPGAMRDFLRVPWEVYRGDPAWVPPLLMERKEALSEKHPTFAHLRWQGWVAYLDERPVGRITAQIDQLHQERYGDRTGFFGNLEMTDDQEVTAALFEQAESWLRDQGMQQVSGPFSMNINQETGVLVEGFESPPFVMMGHARPYYGAAIERCGYHPLKDVLAYEVDAHFETTPVMAALQQRLQGRVRVRPMNRTRLESELETLRDIFNDAWSDNWGFVPFTETEIQHIGNELVKVTPEGFIQIAEIDDMPVAFVALLPNINEAIADLNGRLLPFGWLKLLWRLKVSFPKTGRIALMGVRRHLQHTRFGPGLAFLVVDALRAPAIAKGIERVEMSWILEDNKAMRNIIESLGGEITKRYRVYGKSLQDA